MDLPHIFYKEIPTNDNKIFFANLAENNDAEEVLLKEDQNYMVTTLSINQKAEADVIIPDLNARNSLSDEISSNEEERKKFNLDCHFYKKDLFDVTIPFKERSDILMTGNTYFDTTTNKIETIEFYDYYNHLKDFGFTWENDSVRYDITLSTDQKQIEKKFWCKWNKSVYLKDETKMIYAYNGKGRALGEYQHAFKNFLKDQLKDGKTLYTDTISGEKRDELVRWHYYNMNRFNKLFYSDLSHYQTLFFMQRNNKFNILQSFDKNHFCIATMKMLTKIFLRNYQYAGEETKAYRHIFKKWHIYKFSNSVFNYNPTIYDVCFPKKITNADPF